MSSRPVMRRPLNVARRPGSTTTGGMRRPATSSAQGSGGNRTGRQGNDDGFLYVAGVRDPSKRMTEYRTDQDVCPVCGTDRQFNRNLRLLVSPCYHKMCESCIDRLFTLGPEPCPQCGKILRKINFAHQTFEDLHVEKEVSVRRRIHDIFNKRREDFSSLTEYNQYLEQVEDLTFNILNDVDVPETEAKIAKYVADNASQIATNNHKAAMESLSQNERDDIERRARTERMRMIAEAERVDRAEEDRMKAAVIEAMARPGGQAEAREITASHAKAKAARAAALAATVPPSLAALYGGEPENDVEHAPTSPSYAGPYVAIPYYPDTEDLAPRIRDFADGRSSVIWAKEDRERKVRGGGWDIKLFWEMELRSAMEGLDMMPLG